MPKVQCPKCGNQHLQVVVAWLADFIFDDAGDHEISDGPYGSADFDDESNVICATGLEGCGHSGTLAEFTQPDPTELTEADKAAFLSLRQRGFAVTVFNPRELQGVDSERIEDVMCQGGEDAIQLLKGAFTMSRIPYPDNDTNAALYAWWKQLADLGLAFHPDDPPEDVIDANGKFLFSRDEARQLTTIIEELHSTHGDEIYKAALQATEEPDITAAREHALNHWNDTDIQISPHAEVEKVDGGYWVEARCFVSDGD